MAKRIVLAEDNAEILKLVETTLTFRGYEVFPTRNGQEAWETIQQQQPDGVILDMNMPGMDGLEVCRRIRANPETQHIGVIFLTAYEQLETKVAAYNAGADDYVVKPFVPGELALRVEAILKRADAARTPANSPTTVADGQHDGQVVALFGVKGGVGVSVIAANLAVALATSGQSVCLVDLDIEHAIANMLLDVAPTRAGTIVEVSNTFVPDLDWDALRSYLSAHGSGVKVLPGPISAAQAELVQGEHVVTYLRLLRSHFDYVVVDLPSNFREITLDVFDGSDRLLIVVNPDIPSLKLFRATAVIIKQLQLPAQRLQVVVNQTVVSAIVPLADVRRVVDYPIVATVPFGGEPFLDAYNTGMPIVQKAPQNNAAVAIKSLAHAVTTRSLIGRRRG